MDTPAVDQAELVRLIEQSRKRSKRLFYAVAILSVLFFIFYGPTVIDRFRGYTLGVKSAAVAEQQAQLWQKNMTCVSQPGTEVPAPGNVTVSATICDSGDILVHVRTRDNRETYKWVPLEDVIGREGERGRRIP